MIIEYQRPSSIPEALALLARSDPPTYALGGGTSINRNKLEDFAVVDLQGLGLGAINLKGNQLSIGATATLQAMLDIQNLTQDLYTCIKLETTYNLRQMATIAGTLIMANGRSPLATMLLAMDASLELIEQGKPAWQVRLGDWLPFRQQGSRGTLISSISLPVNVRAVYEYVARTPADQPIVCAGLAQWHAGRTRLALGGWGAAPILALDGPESEGVMAAAGNAYSQAEDEWGSAEYRQEMAVILAERCLARIVSQ